MKQLLLLCLLIGSSIQLIAQAETAENGALQLRRYKLKSYYIFNGTQNGKSYSDTVRLLMSKEFSFKKLNKSQQAKIKKTYPEGSKIVVTNQQSFSDGTKTISKNATVDETFYQKIKIDSVLSYDAFRRKSTSKSNAASVKSTIFYEFKEILGKNAKPKPYRLSGLIKFEKGKLYVFKNSPKDEWSYYYKIANGRKITIPFKERFTANAITIPMKIRFGTNNLKSEINTDVNLNGFFGFGYGKTVLKRRDNVKDMSIDSKHSFGVLLGASTITLNPANTSTATPPLENEIVYGALTGGVGYMYNYQSFHVGLFAGIDRAIGQEAFKWDYQDKIWLGLGVGFSLFKL